MPGPWPWPQPMVPKWEADEWRIRALEAEKEVGVLRLGIQLASSYLDEGEALAKAARAPHVDLPWVETAWLKAGAPERWKP